MKCEWCRTELRQSAHVFYCPSGGRAAGTMPAHAMQQIGAVIQARVDCSVATHKLRDRAVRERDVADYIRKIRGEKD